MKKKLIEMNKEEFKLIEDFKREHDIKKPVKSAVFFWNAQENRNQVESVETGINPFELWPENVDHTPEGQAFLERRASSSHDTLLF